MFTINKLAMDALRIEGDDFDSQYRRAAYVYPLSIALLFPPPAGGTSKLEASAIVQIAKITAGAKLFDDRVFKLDSAWDTTQRRINIQVNGITQPRKTLRPRALFADRVASSLFRKHLFHPTHGLSYLLEIPFFELNEEDFETRKNEMETMADLVNIYMICAAEIEKRSKSTGIDIVINLYLDRSSEMGDNEVADEKTLSKNWKRLNPTAVFHYLYKFQNYSHFIFSPPAVTSANFTDVIFSMSERQGLLALLQAYEYVSNKLNETFGLDLPLTGVPSTSVELHDNSNFRDKYLKHLR